MKENALPTASRHSAADLLPVPLRRFVPLLAMIVVSLGVVGFLVGIREPGTTPTPVSLPEESHRDVPLAPTYSELTSLRQQNVREQQSLLGDLRFEKPGIFDVVTRTEQMKLNAVADRSRNRAYEGAPPTIPHPVEARSAASCLACHAEGIKVGDRVASRVSHAHLTNCTQCHVEQAPAVMAFEARNSPENHFVGVYRSGPGNRASPGAPPVIPHVTWMRENCMSCHGLVTRAGIRTTHPWLTSCTQCHAPSAALDQVDFARGGG